MKRFVILLFLSVLLLNAATGAPAESAEKMYAPILDLYVRGLSGDEAVIESDDFNFSAWQCFITADVDPLASVGYAMLDLDGDGEVELLIADCTDGELADGIVFDIWSLWQDEPVLILRGWERYRLYLTAESAQAYGFYREGSSSAFDSVYEKGFFLPQEPAVTSHELAFTYTESEKEIWKLDTVPVDGGAAQALIAQWQETVFRPEYTPFSSLVP